jgi:hypothetical protein
MPDLIQHPVSKPGRSQQNSYPVRSEILWFRYGDGQEKLAGFAEEWDMNGHLSSRHGLDV